MPSIKPDESWKGRRGGVFSLYPLYVCIYILFFFPKEESDTYRERERKHLQPRSHPTHQRQPGTCPAPLLCLGSSPCYQRNRSSSSHVKSYMIATPSIFKHDWKSLQATPLPPSPSSPPGVFPASIITAATILTLPQNLLTMKTTRGVKSYGGHSSGASFGSGFHDDPTRLVRVTDLSSISPLPLRWN